MLSSIYNQTFDVPRHALCRGIPKLDLLAIALPDASRVHGEIRVRQKTRHTEAIGMTSAAASAVGPRAAVCSSYRAHTNIYPPQTFACNV
ncbi:hypothetical protein EVAR_7940_1 [Eumeta japonica]|uniref:Uncharacterized protein n=1 Tax=Eumeta variegata TaxID=151549 RepID=A0A4C1TK81_EUMVA|nr:hypothetical protein EVAR_7940_1 [Eumeta japonica]